MTRKKSNVKALALAVTCAILAGGGIGLEPVYAAADDVTYDSAGSTLKYEVASTSGGSTTPTEIKKLVVNGVTIGSANGEITASKIVGTGTDPSVEINGVKIGAVSDGSVTMHTIGSAITISGTSTAMYDVNIGNNLTVKGQIIDSNDVSKAVSVADLADAVGQVETNRINIINNKNDIAGLKTKTTGISYSTATGTIVDGVQLKEKGISAAGGAFTVNGTDGETVVSGIGGKTTINHSSIVIEDTTSSKHVIITNEDVNASHSVQAKIIDSNTTARMADGNVVAKNGLYVGAADITAPTKDNSKFSVDGTTGDTAVGGTLAVAGDVTTQGNIQGADITATGALKGKTLGIGTHGTEFTVNADGEVQAAGGKVSIDKTGKAIFGYTAGNITTIEGQKINTGSIVATDTTVASNISGVQMLDGKITASNMEITGVISLNDLTVNNKLTVGAFSVDKNGVVAGVQSINGANVTASGTGLTIGSATVGAANPFSSTGFTVDANGNVAAQNITAGTYNGNTIGADNKFNGVELKGGNVAATKVTAGTITDGIATMTGGKVTANEIAATSASLAGVTFDTSGVDFNNKDIKNVANVTAKTADLGNLHIEGHVIKNNVDAGGPIGLGTTVTVNNAGELGGITKIDGVNVTDDDGGLAIGTGATQVTIGGANAISVGAGTFTVDSAGLVTGNQFITTNGSYLKDNELKLNDANIWNTTEGLKAEKAVIGANTLDTAGISTTGTLGVEGVATFGKDAADQTKITQGKAEFTQGGKTTTIKGGEIETDKLTVNDIVLKNSMKDGAGNTITIKGSDGSMSVAGGKFAVDDKGQVTNHITATGAAAADTIFTTSEKGINATFQKTGETASSGLTIEDNHAALNASGGAALDLKDKTAKIGSGNDSLTTYTSDTIESKVGTDVTRVMTNSATEQSIVDKVGANASRSLKADEIVDAVGTTTVTTNSNGTTFGNNTANNTLIYGSAITSTNGAATGVLDGSNLTLTNGANKTVLDAGKVTYTGKAGYSNTAGTQTTIDGGIITTDTLKVQRIQLGEKIVDQRTGETIGSGVTLASDGGFTAAGGNFKVTGGTTGSKGSIKNVVGDATNGKTAFETNQQGANMSFEKGGIKSEVAVADDSAKISAGASSIEVKNDGITNNGVTTFNGTTGTTTKIDGGTITTNHLITDKLTITGSGNADGTGSTTGSIAFGGNGSITSNIKDAATGKEATFKTDEKGTFTEAKDNDGNKTTNTVNAKGNTNVVTDSTNTSTATQTATSIGGVVTNGTVTMRQELTADGVKVSVDGDTANYTQITNKDVSITDQKNPGKRINLSDLGQLNDLDGELAARDEYQDNKTAVGAINAEAGIRREEVARLDNRIDDVNNRVDKVGAMAAAIASLKSIGYDPQAPSEFSIGLGQYKGETGVAMGFFHYPNKNFMINVSLSTAGGETMGGIGATWRFGHKSPQKLLEEQREEQAKKELAAAEKYQAAAKLAKEAQERAEYAAKLARQAQVSADNAKAAADATQAKHFG